MPVITHHRVEPYSDNLEVLCGADPATLYRDLPQTMSSEPVGLLGFLFGSYEHCRVCRPKEIKGWHPIPVVTPWY